MGRLGCSEASAGVQQTPGLAAGEGTNRCRSQICRRLCVEAYNRCATDMRQKADDFQRRVVRYSKATSTSPVGSGRYSYEPGAVMHATLHHGGLLEPHWDGPPELSAADRAALQAVCGKRLRP